MAQGNITTIGGSRTRANLYNGKYVGPDIQNGINQTYKKRDKVVEFDSDGLGGIIMRLLSLGIASTTICKGTCGAGNDCCEGFLDSSIGSSTNRTSGVPTGSIDLIFNYDQTIYPSGIGKVGFFVAAPTVFGHQIISTFVSSTAGQIVYRLEGYTSAGTLSDEPFIGAIVNMSLFINDAYSAS